MARKYKCMKQIDRRTRKTKEAIKSELMKQMLVLKYNELTVAGISEAADISRRTFYLHYQDIDDVFREIFEEINAPLYLGMENLEKKEGLDEDYILGEIFRLINETIERNTAYLTRLATEQSYFNVQMRHIDLMKRLISTHLKNLDDKSSIHSIYIDYYITGILELYFQWYRHEHDLTLDDIRTFALGIIKADRKYCLIDYAGEVESRR